MNIPLNSVQIILWGLKFCISFPICKLVHQSSKYIVNKDFLSDITQKFKKIFQPGKLNTFGGVFTPDVLTILGVIMYLRLGWVVGNAGFGGALVIILLAKTITICTALSMSSITTNIKIGAGGAYSIIAKSLGLEAGGSVGIPFYISQTLSAALYIVGFTEAWIFIFPSHDPFIISVAAWIILLSISYISALFAIKVQYFILAIIGLSILSFLFTPEPLNRNVEVIGSFQDADFWIVFAIFFPAVTGIMAGANLSGELKNPRKALPVGTISAIIVTLIIYVLLAYFVSLVGTSEELRTNQMIMVEKAFSPALVLLGILAATFSSALNSMVGAPRILQALSSHKSIPLHDFFGKKTQNGEPRNAIIFTGAIIFVALIFGSLDALASLITMFFLITYGTLNLVVFIQQSMKMISFRPTFKVPRIVPLTGAASSLFVMFLINPVFSFIAIVTIIVIYIYLTRKGLQADWGDIRGGMFLVLAEFASRIAAKFPRHYVVWKPDILLPIEEPSKWSGSLLFIKNITYPSGSVFAFSVKSNDREKTLASLQQLVNPLKEEKIFVNSSVIEDENFLHGAKLVIQTLQGGSFRPNTLFLTLGSNEEKDNIINEIVKQAAKHELGIIILRQHPRTAFGFQKTINLWLRDRSPNWHLAILIALQLQLNWEGKINLVTVAAKQEDEKRLYRFLERLSDQTRLPSLTEFHVLNGTLDQVLTKAPRADINIFGLGEELNFKMMRDIPTNINSSCLFIKDSGKESAVV